MPYGVTNSDNSLVISERRDHKRLSNSVKREQNKLTNRLKKRREAKARLEAQLQAAEGGPAYGAGIASIPGAKKGGKRKAKAAAAKPSKKNRKN